MDIQDLLAPATHPADNKRQRGPDGAHVQVCTLVESQAFPNNNNDDLVFESPELAKTHSSWAAFRAYLDDYCSANGLRIGVEFTVSVTSRNRELRMSKRPKSVTLLPDGLECFRRMYVCRLGRKTRARDARGSRTECPFRFTVTSVRRQGQWRVEITRGVFTHDHTQKTNFDFARAGKRQKQRSTAFDQTPTDAMNKLPPNVATAGDLVTSAGTDLLRSLHFAATVMNPTWLIAEDEVQVNDMPADSFDKVIPDGAIKFQVLKKKAFPTRPASCPENIYELVQQMCRFDASERGGLKEVIDGMSELSAKAKVYKPMCSPDELHDFDELYGDWPGQRIVMKLLESPHDKDPAPFY
ncbi:serine/threonine protein kinase [Phytophthora cinnamomi]|uniref:serine/threonine protein kinase n=1 Tax=Phytophthora cinnamomi TaxID=4785 RepID=UPI00355A8EC9|nr:serine/threonine protein kinase [Phytophthora cinnamomi]